VTTDFAIEEKVVEKVVRQKPLHFAPFTIVEGEQKSGKTNFCVTRVINPTFANLTSIKLYNGTPEGLIVKAAPVLNSRGFTAIGFAKIWLPSQSPKIMRVPPRSILRADSIRIFANFHLKGIRYSYLKIPEIVRHLNDGSITGLSRDGSIRAAFLIIDEAYLAGLDKRRSMGALAIVFSQLGYQIAKRHLNVMVALPEANVLGFRTTDIENEHVICTYNEATEEITALIRNRKKYQGKREITYKARPYWKYYDPDEQQPMSNTEMYRAIEAAT
jgi:hypothetical protein